MTAAPTLLLFMLCPAQAQGPYKRALDKGKEVKAAGAKEAAAVAAAQAEGEGRSDQRSVMAQPPRSAPTGSSTVPPGQGVKPGERRDPFVIPIKPPPTNPVEGTLPPGKAGLVIGQANLEGIARTATTAIAVVSTTNGRTFFLRANDKVYHGRVARVTDDSIVFEEDVVDPMGRMLKREVIKKLPAEAR